MNLSQFELEMLAASQSERMKKVEDEVWQILVQVLTSAVDDNSFDSNDSSQEWINEMLKYREGLKKDISHPIHVAFKQAAQNLQNQMDDELSSDMSVEEEWLLEQVKKKLLTAAPTSIDDSKKVKKVMYQHKIDDVKYFGLAANNMTANALKAFKGIIVDVASLVTNRKITTKKAVAMAGFRWADQGIPALIDKAGKHWAPDVYTRLVVTNSINDLYNDVEITRFKEYGGELVKISSHADCRPTHLQYQGKIYSIKGDESKYPDLYSSTNYGNGGGLCGVNCRHHIMPYIPSSGDSFEPIIDKDENNKRYKLVQQQRRYENALRKGKRRLSIAKSSEDEKEIEHCKWLVRRRSKRLRDFTSLNHLTREVYRER